MLTDTQARNAKPGAKSYKLADSNGLYLFVSPAGGKVWRWRYKVGQRDGKKGGREKLLTLGDYPKIGLAEARRRRDAARAELRDGADPGETKRLRKLAGLADQQNSFEAVARRWHAGQQAVWSGKHAAAVLHSLVPVFKEIGSKPVREITPPIVLAILREIEARPAPETARRVRQRMSAVFVFAIASGIGDADPAAIVTGALAPTKKERQPAIIELEDARTMLRTVEGIPAHPITRLALRFLALTAVRPGEVRGARWTEFEDLDGKRPIWRIPAERMKMNAEHVVPLAEESLAVLRAVRAIGIRGELVFPSTRDWRKPLSTNALGYLLHRAGYHSKHVPHGWRSTFSSVMNERFPRDRAIIDLMLSHSIKDTVEGAYNRAQHMERRRRLAQLWAALLLQEAMPLGDLLSGERRPTARGQAG